MGALNNFKRGVTALRSSLVTVGAAFSGSVFALDRFTGGTIKSTVALQNLQNQTGLSIEKLQRLQQVGMLTDLSASAESVSNAMGRLQTNLALIRLSQGNIAPFQLLGVNTSTEDAEEVFEQIREGIKKFDNATASSLIGQTGLSPQFINMLRLSKEEFDKLGNNVFLSKAQRNRVIELGTSFTALKLRMKALKDQVVAKLAPELNKLIRGFFDWMKKNGNKIIATLSDITRVFGLFTSAIGGAASVLADMSSSIFGAENGLRVLAGLATLLLISFSPLLALLVAIVLAFDEINAFRKGGRSFLGDYAKSFLGDYAKKTGFTALNERISAIDEAVASGEIVRGEGLKQKAAEYSNFAVQLARNLIGNLQDLTPIGAISKAIFGKISNGKEPSLIDDANDEKQFSLISGLSNLFKFALINNSSNFSRSAFDFANDEKQPSLINNFSNFSGSALDFATPAGSLSFNSAPETSNNFNRSDDNRSSTVTNNINMNVTTTADATDTANIVVDQIRDAQQSFNNAGR